jgi:hypothetical protein
MKQIFFQTAYIGILSAFLFTISGCKPDKTNTFKTTINFKSTFEGEQLVLNKLVATSSGDSIKFTMSKILLSEIDLLKSDGSSVRVKDAVFFGEAQSFQSVLSDNTANFSSGDFTGIRFNFGLTTAQNNTDPSTAPCPSAYCSDYDMWWGSTLKYTNVKIEGLVKPNGSSTFYSLMYHVGKPVNFRTITITQPIALSKDKDNAFTISLDLKKTLDGTNPMNLSLQAERVTQTDDNPTLATKFADNIVNAFSIQ